jgi:hypothetical protein
MQLIQLDRDRASIILIRHCNPMAFVLFVFTLFSIAATIKILHVAGRQQVNCQLVVSAAASADAAGEMTERVQRPFRSANRMWIADVCRPTRN